MLEQRLAEAEASLEAARKGIVEHEAALRALEAELVALRTLLDGAQRRGPLRIDRNWERLLELIDVEPIHRAAVEAALEGWLHGWVASSRDGIASAAAAVSAAEDARETLLYGPWDRPPSPVPDGLLSVTDLVQAPDHVRRPLAHLLPRVVLVSDRTEAARIVEKHRELRAVTPPGRSSAPSPTAGGKRRIRCSRSRPGSGRRKRRSTANVRPP